MRQRRTIAELAKEAIDIQNASNALGLSKGYAEALQELWDCYPLDTLSLWHHPINQLWVSALHEKSGMGLSDTERYGKAYQACKELANEPVDTQHL
jgi:hypothetical protein